MMELITREEVISLIEVDRMPAVSLFMPTRRAGKDVRENPIRFKNMLSEAHRQLEERGCPSREIQAIRDRGRALVEDVGFWRFQADGLAVFIDPEQVRRYRVPVAVAEQVFVTDRFQITPLLPVINRNGLFFVLALSQSQVRLLHGTQYGVSEVSLEGVPRSLAEALQYDDKEKQHQFHTQTPLLHAAGSGRRAAIHHGQGVGVDDAKTDIRRFLQLVEKGLRPVLGERRWAMILAAAEPVLSIYREVNTYPRLLDTHVDGNPDHVSNTELWKRAWPLAEAHFRAERDAALQRYHQIAATPRAMDDLRRIVCKADAGAVDTLFVAQGQQRWGRYEAGDQTVILHEERQPGDEDLVDFAAARTLLTDGIVYAAEPEVVPGGDAAAAILRF